VSDYTSGTFRDAWRREVLRSGRISDSVRVLLLVLADNIRGKDRISLPRNEIAKTLGRSPQRITERIHLACEAGFLDRVSSGKPGRTAVYQALIPRSEGPRVRTSRKGPDSRYQRGPDVRTLNPWDKGPDGGAAIDRRVVGERREPRHVNGWERPALEERGA
jgi:hypothetical protein